ncbi:hypothetical protein D3C72_2217600 [compost metagenome]
MLHELAHGGQHVAATVWRASLQRKPLVDDQGFVLKQGMEAGERGCSQFAAAGYEGRQGVEAVGHVAGRFEALIRLAGPDPIARLLRGDAQHVQCQSAERAAAQ